MTHHPGPIRVVKTHDDMISIMAFRKPGNILPEIGKKEQLDKNKNHDIISLILIFTN